MKKSKTELSFGLIREIPNDAPAGFGARCIQSGSCLDFVWNRSDVFAITDGHFKALKAIMNAGVSHELNSAYTKAYNAGELERDTDNTVTLYDDKALTIKANTNGSYGYVYLCAYLKPSDDIAGLIWSHEKLIPSIGESVTVRCNNIGDSMVLRHQSVHGYAHLLVLPFNPPEWYRKQNKLGNSWKVCSVSGGEIC